MDLWSFDPVSEDVLRIVQEEHVDFQSALGALTLHWADMERVLRTTLRVYAGVSREVGRSLFSGTRARAAMAQINSIAHNTELQADRVDDLKEIFATVGAINTMRDFIVHHVDGSMIESNDEDPTQRKVTDEQWASWAAKAKTYWVSSSMVRDMCADLTECCWRLQAHWEPIDSPFKRGAGPTGAPVPWRYRPPQPASQRHTNPDQKRRSDQR